MTSLEKLIEYYKSARNRGNGFTTAIIEGVRKNIERNTSEDTYNAANLVTVVVKKDHINSLKKSFPNFIFTTPDKIDGISGPIIVDEYALVEMFEEYKQHEEAKIQACMV